MTRPVFVVDVAACTGCFACSVACKDRAQLPDETDRLRVAPHESGTYPHTSVTFRVTHCFHCAEPPCVEACPAHGITRGEDGLVRLDPEACTACGECTQACPFEAIAALPDGTATKCDACVDEVARGWDPTCVRACPMRALWYGPAEEIPFVPRRRDPSFDDHGIGPAVVHLVR